MLLLLLIPETWSKLHHHHLPIHPRPALFVWDLEETLFITEDILKKVYDQRKGTLVQFIKHIVGLYKFPLPQEKISEAFKTFMIEKNYLNANQVNFLRTLQTVFTKKKHVEFDDLYQSPFTNFGSDAPIPLFNEEDVKEMVQLCNTLEGALFKQ